MYDSFKPDRPMGLMDFVRAAKSCVREISPRELLEKFNRKEDMLVIDVREHGEFENGHIKGAMLVPRGILEAACDPAYPKHLPELAAARDRQIVVYCATSGRSAMACAVMQMMGYRNVINLDGGYTRWAAEGLPEVHEATF